MTIDTLKRGNVANKRLNKIAPPFKPQSLPAKLNVHQKKSL